MSKKHAEDFIKHVQRDEVLRKKVNEASEHIIGVAKAHGYEVDRKDLRQALKDHWKQAGDEDDEAAFVFSETPGF
jgi:predicted ribosomally synthesized peptide with nif11-like leader